MVASRMQFDLIAPFPVQNSPTCLKHLVTEVRTLSQGIQSPGIWPNLLLTSACTLCFTSDKDTVTGFCTCMEGFYLYAFVLSVYLSS